MRYILEREDIGVDRVFILNRILDADYKQKVLSLIKGYTFYELPFDSKHYTTLQDSQKLQYITNINAARNYAVTIGQRLFTYSVLLDTACYFNKTGWNAFTDLVAKDTTNQKNKKYYAIPLKRIPAVHFPNSLLKIMPLGEPALAFRNDATLRFNEEIVFGSNDKVDLLLRLGADPATSRQHIFLDNTLCSSVGYVLRPPTGNLLYECSLYLRMRARKKALQLLIEKADQSASHCII